MEEWIDTVTDKILDWTIKKRLGNIKRIVSDVKDSYPDKTNEEYVKILESRWAKFAGIWGGVAQIPSIIPGIGMLAGIGSASVEILGSVLYQTQLILAILYVYGINITPDLKPAIKQILIDAFGGADHVSKLGASITTSSTKKMFKRTVKRSINRLIGRGVGRYMTRAIPGGLSVIIGYSASHRFARRVEQTTLAYIRDMKLLEDKKQLLLEGKKGLVTDNSNNSDK